MTRFQGSSVVGGIGVWVLRVLLVASLYALVARRAQLPSFPPLTEVLSAGWQFVVPELVIQHLPVTLLRWILSFLFAGSLGLLVGMLLGWQLPLFRAVRDDIDLLRSLPSVLLLTFVMAGFGDGELSRAFPTLYITFVQMVFLVSHHTAIVGRRRMSHLRACGATWAYAWRHCLIYEVLVPVMIAVHQLVAISFLVQVSTELIAGALGNRGVGYILYIWGANFEFARLVAALAALALCGWLLNRLVQVVQNCLLRLLGVGEPNAFH